MRAVLNFTGQHTDRAIFLFHDLGAHTGDPWVCRKLRDLHLHCASCQSNMILVESRPLPAEVRQMGVRYETDLPTPEELEQVIKETFVRIRDETYVDVKAHITLTREGRSLATTVVRRHRLAERFLTDILQLGWADAHHEAGRWEHVISPVVEEALVRVLNDPTTCPHGNPIPGTDYARPTSARPMSDLSADDEFTVERIPEELEFEEGQLDYLEGAGLLPGRSGRVVSMAPDGTTTVVVDGNPVGISSFAASRIVVSDGA